MACNMLIGSAQDRPSIYVAIAQTGGKAWDGSLGQLVLG
jgi:hypothetical protein